MIDFKRWPLGLELVDEYYELAIVSKESDHRSGYIVTVGGIDFSAMRDDWKPTGGMQNVFALIDPVAEYPESKDMTNEDIISGLMNGLWVLKARGLDYAKVLTMCESCVTECDFGMKGYVNNESV